jgi:hypothetical protein
MSLIDLWNPPTLTALSAIGGSLVGALGSSVSAWVAQRHQDRRDLLAKKISHREKLYSDFIDESARAMIDAIQRSLEDPSRVIPSYALLSRIRLSSSTNVVESAERVLTTILNTYSQPNLTPKDFQSMALRSQDPLYEFSNVCRHELESLWSGL